MGEFDDLIPGGQGTGTFDDLTPTQSLAWSAVPRKAWENIGSSSSQLLEDTIQPFIHPIDTAKSLGNLALGGAQKLVPGVQDEEKYVDAMVDFFANRYGGEEEFKNTLANDPAGFIADISTILSAGGSLAGRVPGVAGQIARGTRTVADLADPLNLTAKAAGKVAGPQTRSAVKNLMAQGVTPTPGQVLGGGFKKAEDAIMSVPVLGSAIAGGRQRANQQMNKAAYNRALNPIGKNAKDLEIGAAGISDVSDMLSDAYEALLPKVTLAVDDQLIDGIASAVSDAKLTMDDSVAKALDRIVDNKVINRLTRGELSGQELKVLQEEINTVATKFKGGTASERMAGDALNEIQHSLREALARANPKYADELKAIDTGYANYARLRNAGGAAGADIEGFTPAQLRAAVKSSDKSMGKGDTARGRALMQDLSMDAREVMGNDLPTSGTVERALLASMLAGGAMLDPTTAAIVGAGSVPYLPGVQRGMAHALSSRPDAIRTMGQALGRYGPTVARAAFQSGRAKNEMQNALGAR